MHKTRSQVFFGLALSTLICCSPLTAQQLTPQSTTKTPVLVELFTSEGCSSCPPADRLLTELKLKQPVANSQVIALGFHVDYWDHEGWRDRFSAHEFTERQKKYAERLHDDVYTPQLVVDGVAPVSDGGLIVATIAKAGAEAKPSQITLRQSGGDVAVTVSGSTDPAEAFLAVVEDDLTTAVRGGENKDRKLQHAAVVRDWHALGAVAGPHWSTTVHLNVAADAIKNHMQIVAFAQNPRTGKVLGASSIPIR